MRTRLTLAALMATLALPALADEPGPGGSRPPIPKDGADIYRTYCQVCHMADAKGAAATPGVEGQAATPPAVTPAPAVTPDPAPTERAEG